MRERIIKLAAVLSKCTDEDLLGVYVDITIDAILNYCNIAELPQALESTAALMTADMLKAEGHAAATGNVKSISRGDTKIEYVREAGTERAGEFLKNHRARLDSFRKPKIPRSRQNE